MWLILYLGECFPCEFVKSAQALDMPIHQGKMDAEYTTSMWSDAGVGVAGQHIIMKYFINFFKYKFTAAKALINQLPHCHWFKLPSSQWQALGHAPGIKWTLQELK
jgi:hypothetical protein